MAIFIPGMPCALTGQRIDSSADAVMFSPFVTNEADPLYAFSDAVIHADVLRAHPLGPAALARHAAALEAAAPRNRICRICRRLITDPDDYVGLGHLVEGEAEPLQAFNFAHFHLSCLPEWPQLAVLTRELKSLDDSGRWKGPWLKRLLEVLVIPKSPS